MSKFKVGDVCYIYCGIVRHKAKVDRINPNDTLEFEHMNETYSVKQCRKLKPKRIRRTIWVNEYKGEISDIHWESREKAASIHPFPGKQICFIEAETEKVK